jgi:hypothetical protein
MGFKRPAQGKKKPLSRLVFLEREVLAHELGDHGQR